MEPRQVKGVACISCSEADKKILDDKRAKFYGDLQKGKFGLDASRGILGVIIVPAEEHNIRFQVHEHDLRKYLKPMGVRSSDPDYYPEYVEIRDKDFGLPPGAIARLYRSGEIWSATTDRVAVPVGFDFPPNGGHSIDERAITARTIRHIFEYLTLLREVAPSEVYRIGLLMELPRSSLTVPLWITHSSGRSFVGKLLPPFEVFKPRIWEQDCKIFAPQLIMTFDKIWSALRSSTLLGLWH